MNTTPSTPVDIAAKVQVATTLKVGSFLFVVPSQPIQVSIVQTALYKKEYRPKQDSEDQKKLIVSFIAYQGAKYKLISTSTKDPNMLTTAYSLTKLMTITKNHMIKYDAADHF